MVIIWNDDEAWKSWREANPVGYVLNSYVPPNEKYLMLHSTGCRDVSGEPANGERWTTTYSKSCSTDRQEIERWVLQTFGRPPQVCGNCGCAKFR